jgi:hypothetical protein
MGTRYMGRGMTSERREILFNGMAEALYRKTHEGPWQSPSEEDLKKARKSLKLAERIAVATRETSVWNTDLEGNDPLAEAIYLQKYRTERTKDRGTSVTLPIEGFGTSFLRQAKNVEVDNPQKSKRYISELPLNLQDLRLRNPKERISTWIAHNRAPKTEKLLQDITKLRLSYPETFDYSLLSENAYISYLSSHVVRVLKTKDLFQKSTWEPKDLSSDAVEKMYDLFDTVDPESVYGLKAELIIGIYVSVFYDSATAINLGWDNFAFESVEKSLTRALKVKDGKPSSFLTDEQLDKIKEILSKKYHINIKRKIAWGITRYQVVGKLGLNKK